MGFLIGDAPSLRIWYGDSTLRGGYYREFRSRPSGVPTGADRFFRYDTTAGWIEVVLDAEDVLVARQKNPRWREDHEHVALTLERGRDWRMAEAEYAKLADAFPDSIVYPYSAALAALARGDSSGARRWLGRAAAIPAR